MWLPPTPPSEDSNDYYVDNVVEMNYDTQIVIDPTVLLSVATYRWALNYPHVVKCVVPF